MIQSLFACLVTLCQEQNVWLATPGEMNQWWRQPAKLRIVEDSKGIRIEGAGCERARIAYARAEDGSLSYTLEPSAVAIGL